MTRGSLVISPDPVWFRPVEQSLGTFGGADRYDLDAGLKALDERTYALVIVDAGYVDDLHGLITRILRCSPDTRVVIATASPTWRRAREALLAGAADYIRRTSDVAYLRSRWAQILVTDDGSFESASRKRGVSYG